MSALLHKAKSSKLVNGYARSRFTKNIPKVLIVEIICFYDEVAKLIQQCLITHDPVTQLKCVQKIRKLMQRNPSNQETIVESGILSRLVEFLTLKQIPRLQLEAAWTITNIATDHAQAVVNNGAIPNLIETLSSPHDEVKEQAIWALGNIAGESPKYRDLVISCGILSALLQLFYDHTNGTKQPISIIETATFTLLNLCRHEPQLPLKYVLSLLEVLAMAITIRSKREVLENVCWGYSFLTASKNENEARKVFNKIRESGTLIKLIDLCFRGGLDARHAALKTIGNLVAGDDAQKQCILDAGILKKFGVKEMRKCNGGYTYHLPIEREECRIISSITAGNVQQIQQVIQHRFLVRKLTDFLGKCGEPEVKSKVLLAIDRVVCECPCERFVGVVTTTILHNLCLFLMRNGAEDAQSLLFAIQILSKIGLKFKRINLSNAFAKRIQRCGGKSYLEGLTSNSSVSTEIHEKVNEILKEHFEHRDVVRNQSICISIDMDQDNKSKDEANNNPSGDEDEDDDLVHNDHNNHNNHNQNDSNVTDSQIDNISTNIYDTNIARRKQDANKRLLQLLEKIEHGGRHRNDHCINVYRRNKITQFDSCNFGAIKDRIPKKANYEDLKPLVNKLVDYIVIGKNRHGECKTISYKVDLRKVMELESVYRKWRLYFNNYKEFFQRTFETNSDETPQTVRSTTKINKTPLKAPVAVWDENIKDMYINRNEEIDDELKITFDNFKANNEILKELCEFISNDGILQ